MRVALRVCRKHGRLRNCKTRFDSSAGCCRSKNLSSECAGFALEPAKLVDQVRFLARTLEQLTLEPDGTATAWGTAALIIKGVFRTTTIDLAEISAALWRWQAYGSIKLVANQRRIWIDLNIQRSNRLKLIRCLRRGIAASVQSGWADFYYYQFTDRQDRWDRPTGSYADQLHCGAPDGRLSDKGLTRAQFALYCALPLVVLFLLPAHHPIAVVLKWLIGAVWLGLEFRLFRSLRERHRRQRRYVEEKYSSAQLD